MLTSARSLVVIAAAASLLVWAAQASAVEAIVPQSVVNPADSTELITVPLPTSVSGKEYSTDTDKNAAGVAAPCQTVHWYGNGTVTDSLNYVRTSDQGGGNPPMPWYTQPSLANQVDALANIRDKYFLDLVADRVSMLACFDTRSDVYYSRSSARPFATDVWAHGADDINDNGSVTQIDALEVWGPEEKDDGNMFSLKGDPVMDGSSGLQRVSVFRYHPEASSSWQASVPYLLRDTIVSHVITDNGNLVDWGALPGKSDLVDLDALMVWDVADDDEFGAGDKILFSIRAIAGVFDGGEIWRYTYGDAKASFLQHGTTQAGLITWNTLHNVSEHFFGQGATGYEDIGSLEALPEPASLSLLALGACVTVLRRRR